MLLIYIFTFLLGSIIGSFLNVVIYRFNTGRSIVADRSICFSCGKKLSWFELIPVLSYVLQKGKCRKCRTKISAQYVIVEAITGSAFLGIVALYNPVLIAGDYIVTVSIPILILDAFYALIWSILIVIFIYDLKHKIIPDELSYLFAILSLIKLFIVFDPTRIMLGFPNLVDLLAGPVFFLPFFALWYISKGTWIGLGDGKLVLGIGWFLGMTLSVSAVILAFWIGAAVGVGLVLFKYLAGKRVFHRIALSLGLRERIMKSELPFAPFLIIGIALVFFFHLDIVQLLLTPRFLWL